MAKQDKVRLIDGVEYPRVTTILHDTLASQGLMIWMKTIGVKTAKSAIESMPDISFNDWRGKLTKPIMMDWLDSIMTTPEKIGGEAADIGTRVHNLIFDYLSGNPHEVQTADPAYVPYQSFLEWAKTSNLIVEPEVFEYTVVNKEDKYCGQLDFMVKIGGELAIVDWKTSGAIYIDYLIQAVAYMYAWNSMHPDKLATRCFVVRFDKQIPQPPDIIEIPKTRIPELYNIFMMIRKVWELKGNTQGKKRLKSWLLG